MEFAAEPDRTSGKWNVVNPRGKICHTAETKVRAEDVARQATLLSGAKRCEETVVKDGQPQMCDRPLDERGYCDRPGDHA